MNSQMFRHLRRGHPERYWICHWFSGSIPDRLWGGCNLSTEGHPNGYRDLHSPAKEGGGPPLQESCLSKTLTDYGVPWGSGVVIDLSMRTPVEFHTLSVKRGASHWNKTLHEAARACM